jgi:hypothetical protein
MADILLAVIVGLCGAAMAALGVYVSFVPLSLSDGSLPFLKRRRVWVSALFVFLTLVIVGLSAIQTYRNGKQQSELVGSLSDVNQKLITTQNALQSSALSQEFMKGQLSGLSMMVGKLNSDGSSDSANLVKALHQIGNDQSKSTGVEPPAIQRLTTSQLREKVNEFANNLRKATNDFREQQRQHFMNAQQEIYSIPGDQTDKRNKAILNMETSELVEEQNFELKIRQEYFDDATMYRDELLRRLGPQPPSGDWPAFWVGGAGMAIINEYSCDKTADYLQHLARQLQ